jgi:membrane protease YdiL (CAAX protease family)
MTISDWAKGRPLLVFFVLACAITWALMIPAMVIAAKQGYVLPSPVTFGELVESGFADGQHVAVSILLALSQGPLIAAILVASIKGGRAGLREWWGRVTRWRVGGRGYLYLMLLLAALYVPVVVIGLIFGLFPAAGALAVPLVYIAPFFLYEFFTSGMEEPGWRGYALPNLQTRYTAKKSSLILGLVWGLWHWPVFIETCFNALNDPATPLPAAVISTVIQFVIYAGVSILPMTFIHTWLYNRTRSAFMSILLHTMANVLSGYTLATHPAIGMMGGAVRWIVAIILMRFFWQEASTEGFRDQAEMSGFVTPKEQPL